MLLGTNQIGDCEQNTKYDSIKGILIARRNLLKGLEALLALLDYHLALECVYFHLLLFGVWKVGVQLSKHTFILQSTTPLSPSDKFWEHFDSNPRQLGVKYKRYHCAMLPHLPSASSSTVLWVYRHCQMHAPCNWRRNRELRERVKKININFFEQQQLCHFVASFSGSKRKRAVVV